MAGGFFALLDDVASILDDVAAMTKVATKKTAGVLGDDLALNANQLTGIQASRELPSEPYTLQCWSGEIEGRRIAGKTLTVVPILRAGLGMLDGVLDLIPTAKISVVGLQRDEETLQPVSYFEKFTSKMDERPAWIIDPMLATGHTLIDAVNYLLERGARDVTCVCLLAAPEGLRNLEEAVGDRADVTIVSAALDERLNENGYIIPGLGDAGDKIFGTK